MRRGARIYAELVGYGVSSDAHHMTSPPDTGEGAARCMRMALADAQLDPRTVGYVNAHGTSTKQGDIAETRAVHSVFGDHVKSLAVSSTKSMTGHLLGAAGGIEAAFSVLAIHDSVIPPTINLDQPDAECDLELNVTKLPAPLSRLATTRHAPRSPRRASPEVSRTSRRARATLTRRAT